MGTLDGDGIRDRIIHYLALNFDLTRVVERSIKSDRSLGI